MKAKKSLGQNFLKSKTVIYKMIDTAGVAEGDIVLEIGPGKGALTKGLLESGAKVIAVEADIRMVEILKDKFEAELAFGQLLLIHADILKTDLISIGLTPNTPYKLIANIPYYITGEIIQTFLSHDHQPTSMTLMVQKEVAERIVSKDSKESILSISVKIYGEPKYVKTVSKKLFSPSPKVDSAILYIGEISKGNFATTSEEEFFYILKKGFSHKRKMIGGNLKNIITLDQFNICNIDPHERAEKLNTKQWLCITNTKYLSGN